MSDTVATTVSGGEDNKLLYVRIIIEGNGIGESR